MEKARGDVKEDLGATWNSGRELSLSKPALLFLRAGQRRSGALLTSNPSLRYLLCVLRP